MPHLPPAGAWYLSRPSNHFLSQSNLFAQGAQHPFWTKQKSGKVVTIPGSWCPLWIQSHSRSAVSNTRFVRWQVADEQSWHIITLKYGGMLVSAHIAFISLFFFSAHILKIKYLILYSWEISEHVFNLSFNLTTNLYGWNVWQRWKVFRIGNRGD